MTYFSRYAEKIEEANEIKVHYECTASAETMIPSLNFSCSFVLYSVNKPKLQYVVCKNRLKVHVIFIFFSRIWQHV